MTIQYIDFTTKEGFATIWDSLDGAPADAVPIDVAALYRLAHPSNRYSVDDVGGGDFQIVDTHEGWEVCMITSHSDLTEGTIEQARVMVVDALNRSVLGDAMDWECEPEEDV